MQRFITIILLLVLAEGGSADGPGMPRPTGLPLGGEAAWAVQGESDAPASPLADFRQSLRKLKEERDALKEDRQKVYRWMEDDASPTGSDVSKLQYRLSGLLMQITSGKAPSYRPVPAPMRTEDPKKTVEGKAPILEKTVPAKADAKEPAPKETTLVRFANAPDPLTLALALFKAGNHQDALHAFRLVPMEELKTAEKMPLKYLLATCLRKQGKTEEAANLYREVANFAGDENLASCAQWQLANMRWRKEAKDQLQSVRERRLALETSQ